MTKKRESKIVWPPLTFWEANLVREPLGSM